ncbi:MAG: hypothetical protein H0Z40_04840 [Desulfotomaculum sp.]|nr:hypothetical protein [Desulfotomaculum sp.]
MMMELLSSLTNFSVQDLKNKDPDKYQDIIKLSVNLTNMGIEMLRESPEFRESFARIHNEFLKYPESRSTIEHAYQAQQHFAPHLTENNSDINLDYDYLTSENPSQ